MLRIATLTINPAVDISTATPRIVPVHKLRCRAGRHDPGGGGINVGRVAHRLGAHATAIYPAGGLLGQFLTQLVSAEGVACIAIPVTDETRVDFTVLDEASNQQYRFVLPGPHLGAADRDRCLEAVAQSAAAVDYFCASGSLPPGVPDDFYAQAAKIVHGKGCSFALDSSGPALRAALTEHVGLIKPSLRELEELIGTPLTATDAQIAACRKIVTDRGVGMVALTLGPDGALLVTGANAWHGKPGSVTAQNVVGAGDSFMAALIWALASRLPAQDALRHAVAAGSAAVIQPGTELAHADDIRRLMGTVEITAL